MLSGSVRLNRCKLSLEALAVRQEVRASYQIYQLGTWVRVKIWYK
jgi:hypothetical protein